MVQRSLRVKLSLSDKDKKTLLETMEKYSKCFNFYSNWSSVNKSISKKVAHFNSYQESKKLFPTLPTALIQSARDLALDDTNYIILADSSGGKLTIKLPDAKEAKGRVYTIKALKTAGNPITLQPAGGSIDTMPDVSSVRIPKDI
jgi:predicted transposase